MLLISYHVNYKKFKKIKEKVSAYPIECGWWIGTTLHTGENPGAIKYVDSADTIEYTTRIYKKSYTVVPGETVKASVGGFPKVDDNPETDEKYTIPPMIFVKAK